MWGGHFQRPVLETGFPGISRTFPGHFQEFSGKLPGNVREHFRKFPGFREMFGNFPGNVREMSGNFPGDARELSGKCPGHFQEFSRIFPENRQPTETTTTHHQTHARSKMSECRSVAASSCWELPAFCRTSSRASRSSRKSVRLAGRSSPRAVRSRSA